MKRFNVSADAARIVSNIDFLVQYCDDLYYLFDTLFSDIRVLTSHVRGDVELKLVGFLSQQLVFADMTTDSKISLLESLKTDLSTLIEY